MPLLYSAGIFCKIIFNATISCYRYVEVSWHVLTAFSSKLWYICKSSLLYLLPKLAESNVNEIVLQNLKSLINWYDLGLWCFLDTHWGWVCAGREVDTDRGKPHFLVSNQSRLGSERSTCRNQSKLSSNCHVNRNSLSCYVKCFEKVQKNK